MNTELLIHQLAIDARPVRPLGRPVVRLAVWVLFAAAVTSFGVFLIGVRSDIDSAFAEPVFVLRIVLTLGISLVASFAALTLAVPGKEHDRSIGILAAAVSSLVILLAYLFYSTESFLPGSGAACVRNILLLGSAAGALLYFMLKEAAPLRSGTVGMLAALGATAFANLGTQFICRNDNPAHIFVWHLVPIALLCGIGILLGRLIFTWNEQKRPRIHRNAN